MVNPFIEIEEQPALCLLHSMPIIVDQMKGTKLY